MFRTFNLKTSFLIRDRPSHSRGCYTNNEALIILPVPKKKKKKKNRNKRGFKGGCPAESVTEAVGGRRGASDKPGCHGGFLSSTGCAWLNGGS